MVHAADVDAVNVVPRGGDQRRQRVHVAHEQNPRPRVGLPFAEMPRHFGDGGEDDVDPRWHAHAIEILLPGAVAHLVVHQHDETDVERLAPTDHDLAVNETVVEPDQGQAHAAGMRIARDPASTARFAASAGGRSRWKTKSSSIARFTPVTTASSPRPRASRMALERQEPPGRSTNSTAGRPPTAVSIRSTSALGSHPSLLTDCRASATPEIVRTAPTSAAASSACDTMTPTVPAAAVSLIVLFEILPDLRPLLHLPDQPLVELAGDVHAAVAQQV